MKYVPVMARPMVMYRDKHPIVWTGVYADIEVRIFCIHKLYKKCIKNHSRMLEIPNHTKSFHFKIKFGLIQYKVYCMYDLDFPFLKFFTELTR